MGMHQMLGPSFGASDPDPVDVTRSLRFNSGDSAYLSRTPSSVGNRRTWTWSGWVKRTNIGGVYPRMFGNYTGGSYTGWDIEFNNNDKIDVHYDSGSGNYIFRRTTTQVFRDPSAWYHIVVAVDTTDATANDRVKLYVNGEQITAFDTNTNAAQDTDTNINTAVEHRIGYNYSYSDFYLANVEFIDGQALLPTKFGEFNDDGIWGPIEYLGSYGTNGFYLKFADNSNNAALGTDSSGNSNTWTVNNLSVAAGSGNDSLFDSPTNLSQSDTGAGGQVSGNYATWSPLVAQSSGSITLSNGNLDTTCGSTRTTAMSSFPLTGKTYWEVTFGSGTYNYIGMTEATGFNTVANNNSGIKYTGYQSYSYGWQQTDGKLYKASNIIASPGGYSNGNVLGWAYDADNNTLKLYKNGSLVHTENNIADAQYFPAITHSGTATASTNFGQRAFAYAAPSGYKPVSTATSLPAPTIADGSDYFDTKLYTGNGSTQSISGYGFSPDFVWIKCRSAAKSHSWFDSVRGATKLLKSDDTQQESTQSGGVTSFNSDGFSIGSRAGNNENNATFAAWAWDAGTSTVSNTDGSITSNVRASATSGFSIVSWTGTGATGSIGHGLNSKPQIVITKNRTDSAVWVVDVIDVISSGTSYMLLNTNQAASSGGSTADNSVVNILQYNDRNGSGDAMIAYCFTSVEGFSSIGKYSGNGSTDGPFVQTGFRPAFVMVKRTNSTEQWAISDTARDTYNPVDDFVWANANSAEDTNSVHDFDYLSNGFKLRYNHVMSNGSGSTYLYMAFAEHPFKTARAR